MSMVASVMSTEKDGISYNPGNGRQAATPDGTSDWHDVEQGSSRSELVPSGPRLDPKFQNMR